mmetsp:Transcript_28261/g.28547  ORF Transcript_28261/g.28547 Transcript_28261/m.28547 type:complete len:89 (+) Transcript_28261:248-514(+)
MSIADNTLPDFFPLAPKQCKVKATSFFDCFTVKSAKQNDNDSQSGVIGLAACLQQKKEYEKCMIAYEKSHVPKRYRVQEEYRVQKPKT